MTTSILRKIRGAIADPFRCEALNKSTADLSSAFQEFYKGQAQIAETMFQLGKYIANKARAGDEEAIGLLNRYEVRLEDTDGTVLWDYRGGV